MRPIIDFNPGDRSPPLAPKHITAQPIRAPKKNKDGTDAAPAVVPGSAAKPLSAAQLKAKAEANQIIKEKKERDREERKLAAAQMQRRETSVDFNDSVEERGSEDGDSMTDASLGASDSSRTPSPILGSGDEFETDSGGGRKRKFRGDYDQASQRQRYTDDVEDPYATSIRDEYLGGPDRYEDIILDYFISETSQIPSILINPPLNFDPNVPIDDDGHTALHWACAMGRVRVVKLLLTAGADIFRVNHADQTALMRSVMFSNNYDVRKFPELYELLHRSTLNIDKTNRTVFHHIADVALSKGKTHAARYYMETILNRLSDYPKELGDVINYQDDEGETALTLAARARSKRLVKSLIDHGADPKLANRDGKTAEDYILEDERFRSSPVIGTSTGAGDRPTGTGALGGTPYASGSGGGATNGYPHQGPGANATASTSQHPHQQQPKIYHSQPAIEAAGRSTNDLVLLLASLAKSFDTELLEKDKSIAQINGLMTSVTREIAEVKKAGDLLKMKLGNQAEESGKVLAGLKGELEGVVGGRYARGWKEWSAKEMEKEQAFVRDPSSIVDEAERRVLEARLRPEVSEGEKVSLSQSVDSRKARRVELFAEYVRLLVEQGAGERMGKYRFIVKASVGLGEGREGDLDGMMEELLEVSDSLPRSPPLPNVLTSRLLHLCFFRRWKQKTPTTPPPLPQPAHRNLLRHRHTNNNRHQFINPSRPHPLRRPNRHKTS